MTMLQHSVIESGGYNIDRSLRFRSSASAYLNRTPASASNRKTWTWSGWVKRGALGVYSPLFIAGTTNGQQVGSLAFSSAGGVYDKLELNFGVQGTSTEFWLQTTQVFRDPSAWYHIVVAVDTTQATASNRVKFYVNGSQITALGAYASYNQYPSQNYDTSVNNTVQHLTSRDAVNTAGYFDGYLAEVNFIDGQALTPSSFGETSTETGVWVPKKYTGTYGTNGFYLNFSDNTSATTLAYDKSGNGNNWTPNNISTTAGATYDSMTDVPTLTSATAANYCVLNPLNTYAATIIDGNQKVTLTDASSSRTVFGTMAVSSGKWYWEMLVGTAAYGYYPGIGVETNLALPPTSQSGDTATGYVYLTSGQKLNSGLSSYAASYTTNDVIGVALDMDAGTITFYKNNTSQGQAFSGITGTAIPCFVGSGNASAQVNFGQRPFSYTPPTGFKALNTYNLPDPTIKKPNQYMDAYLNTGSGTTRTDVIAFQPDLVWTKTRNTSTNGFNIVQDSVRGAGNRLITDGTYAESYDATYGSFTSTGFQFGSNLNVNTNGNTYVDWFWKESATAGFDIVTYTGNGAAGRTISHSLGVAPAMYIVKTRDIASPNYGWEVYHKSLGATKSIVLNSTSSALTSTGFWNDTAPTSSVFTVGNDWDVNKSAATYVAYLFAEIPGFSKFGSYTGNGSTDGPFVYCGFRPKYIMVKQTSASGEDWIVQDTARAPYNNGSTSISLFPDSSSAEVNTAAQLWDVTSNGFKIRASGGGVNTNGATYIYAAFASNPFKFSTAF